MYSVVFIQTLRIPGVALTGSGVTRLCYKTSKNIETDLKTCLSLNVWLHRLLIKRYLDKVTKRRIATWVTIEVNK